MTQRTLLFGSSGYVGSLFKQQLERNSINVVCAPSHLTLASEAAVSDLVTHIKPTVVINAGGFTGKPNVDACETQQQQCEHGNVTFPLWIARASDRQKVPFAQVSSGCIYNGHEKVYTEADAPDFSFVQNNCSFYSGTKALAEEQLKQFPKTYTWRLRIPFDHHNNPRNFLTKMLNYSTILSLPNSVSHRYEFVDACLKTLELHVPYGIYNITNPGAIDARTVLNMFAKLRPETKSLVDGKNFFESVDQFMKIAVAPRSNCVLSSQKLESFGIHLRPVEQAVSDSISNYDL